MSEIARSTRNKPTNVTKSCIFFLNTEIEIEDRNVNRIRLLQLGWNLRTHSGKHLCWYEQGICLKNYSNTFFLECSKNYPFLSRTVKLSQNEVGIILKRGRSGSGKNKKIGKTCTERSFSHVIHGSVWASMAFEKEVCPL